MIAELLILLVANGILWLWLMVVPTFVVRIRRLHVRGALGLALPGIVLLTDRAWNERALRHELAHQRQMRRYTPLGAALALGWIYGSGFLKGRIREGRWPSFWHLWQNNPLEIEANAAMNATDPLPRLFGWSSPERRPAD